MNLDSSKIAEAIARARATLAEKSKPKELSYGERVIQEARSIPVNSGGWRWNTAQQQAIDKGLLGESFCLIGAAGTGKTTTLKELVLSIIRSNKLPILEKDTKHLSKGAPGVVLFSYTRRAVRNIARQMPDELKSHCITGHKLLEFRPERFEIDDNKGGTKLSLRFVPYRTRFNPLPANLRLIIIDESSMVSSDFFRLVLDALPNPKNVQFIFLGDLHQLPPVYGDAILGHKLLERNIVELTEVYRQALESPIIDLAIQVKDNKLNKENKAVLQRTIIKTPRGTVTLHPWKSKLDVEEGMFAMQKFLRTWVKTGNNPANNGDGAANDPLNFEDDVILCPWNKSFGNIELNKAIGTELALKYDREVYEIIAGYNKVYYSIGDRILHEKRDAIITRIVRNTRYIGKQPQYHNKAMDYWGYTSAPATLAKMTEEEIEDSFGDMLEDIEDRVHEASHAIYFRYVDSTEEDQEEIISSSGAINATELAYCMSVHKSQGSEWRRVILITHGCHSKMLSREMAYTAITRASQELYIFMEPMMLTKAANQPRIKGDKLEDKLRWFEQKQKENAIMAKINKQAEDDDE